MLTGGDWDFCPYPMAQWNRSLRQVTGDAYYYASAQLCGPQRPLGSRPHVRSSVFDCGSLDAGRINRSAPRGQANHDFWEPDGCRSPEGDRQAGSSRRSGFAGQWDQPADDCSDRVCGSELFVRPGQQHGREDRHADLREVPSGQRDGRANDRLARYAVLGLVQPYAPFDDGGRL